MKYLRCFRSFYLSNQVSKCLSSTSCYDIGVVGGGIVGLATAREIKLRYPRFTVAVHEKENELSMHQSGHNSGVIHAGIYYAPGSMKAKLCVEGLNKSYEYAKDNNVPFKKCGKLVVAVTEDDLPKLDELHRRSQLNGCPNVSFVSSDEIKEIEPNCVGIKALHCPETGIIDWRLVALSYAENFKSLSGKIYLSSNVDTISESPNPEYPVLAKSSIGDFYFKYVICCAGLQSDRLAQRSGCSKEPTIIPFRGDYLMIKPELSHLIKGNIYPVPDPRFPFLGVHFTPRMDGSILLGPNAMLSFDRESYGILPFNFKDTVDSIRHPGFRKLAFRYFKFGLNEVYGNIFISKQIKQLQRYVPSLKREDVTRGPRGIRAQALGLEGQLIDDFVLQSSDGALGKRIMHVRNAPSPAATASLAIARVLADEAKERFGLPTGEPRVKV